MFFSLLYLAVRSVLGLLVRCRRGPDVKDVELVRAGNSIRSSSRGAPVFVDEASEYVLASDPVETDDGC
jgi:hypothetical protein